MLLLKLAKITTLAIVGIVILILIFPQYAYAYIDPGAGSYIFQIIIATLVAGLFVIKSCFNKIKIFFVNICSRKKDRLKHDNKTE
jgi:hypothetical protein